MFYYQTKRIATAIASLDVFEVPVLVGRVLNLVGEHIGSVALAAAADIHRLARPTVLDHLALELPMLIGCFAAYPHLQLLSGGCNNRHTSGFNFCNFKYTF